MDLPAREDSPTVDGAEAATASPGAPAPRSGSTPGGWAAPPLPKAAAWATAPPKTATPGKTAAVPPRPGTAAADQAGLTGPMGPSGPARGRNGRRTLLIAAGVAVVLIAVAACLLLLRAHRQAKPTSPPTASASSPAAQAQTPTAAAAGVASTALPAGWQWYTASAKTLGTNAGFKLAIPDGWNAYPKGAGVLFEAPGNDTFLQVDLTPHTKASMLAEARYLAQLTQRQGKFPGYSDQSIRAVNIRNSGRRRLGLHLAGRDAGPDPGAGSDVQRPDLGRPAVVRAVHVLAGRGVHRQPGHVHRGNAHLPVSALGRSVPAVSLLVAPGGTR